MMTDPVLVASNISRGFSQGEERLDILKDANLELKPGEAVALVAPSGTGKSTLLQIIGLLEKPDSGEISVMGRPTVSLNDAERTAMRRSAIGFVYQAHHLLPEFTALENVMLPQLIKGLTRAEARKRADDLLGWLGLAKRVTHRPSELSGGEQQRVAIARAIANAPRILLADEPTGNLDPVTSDHVFKAMLTLVRASGVGALVATHNLELASRMDRRITIHNGQVQEI